MSDHIETTYGGLLDQYRTARGTDMAASVLAKIEALETRWPQECRRYRERVEDAAHAPDGGNAESDLGARHAR